MVRRIVLPLAVATFLDGLTFGLVARAAGVAATTAVCLSAFSFSGSAQFAAVGLIGAGGGVLAALAPALLLNAGSLPMGLSIAPGALSRRRRKQQRTASRKVASARRAARPGGAR